MKDTSVIIRLFCLLAILLGAYAALRFHGETEPSILRRAVLLPGGGASIRSVTIERDGERAIVLERDDAWRIVSPFTGKADESAVLRMLDNICFQPVLDARERSDIQRIGLSWEDFGFTAKSPVLTFDGAGLHETVRIGGRTPVGSSVYVSLDSSDSIFLVSTNVLSAVAGSVDDFRPREILSITADSVSRVDVRRGDGGVVRLARKDGVWNMTHPSDARAAKSQIASVFDAFESLRIVSFVWPRGGTNETAALSSSLLAGFGLDSESAVSVLFGADDGRSSGVSFGAEAGEGLVYALIKDESVIVTVPARLKDVLSRPPSDFADMRLFPVKPSAVGLLSICDGATRYVASLQKDGSWWLDSPVSGPADSKFVKDVVLRLSTLVTTDVVTNGILVCMTTNAAPVSVSRESVLNGGSLAEMRSREILSVNPLEVRRLSVFASAGERPVAAVFDRERRLWSVETADDGGSRIDEEAVAVLLDALNPLVAEKVVCLAAAADELRLYGLDDPKTTVAVDSDVEGVARRNILIGASDGAGGAYVTIGASDAVFLVSAETLGKLSASIVVPVSQAD